MEMIKTVFTTAEKSPRFSISFIGIAVIGLVVYGACQVADVSDEAFLAYARNVALPVVVAVVAIVILTIMRHPNLKRFPSRVASGWFKQSKPSLSISQFAWFGLPNPNRSRRIWQSGGSTRIKIVNY